MTPMPFPDEVNAAEEAQHAQHKDPHDPSQVPGSSQPPLKAEQPALIEQPTLIVRPQSLEACMQGQSAAVSGLGQPASTPANPSPHACMRDAYITITKDEAVSLFGELPRLPKPLTLRTMLHGKAQITDTPVSMVTHSANTLQLRVPREVRDAILALLPPGPLGRAQVIRRDSKAYSFNWALEEAQSPVPVLLFNLRLDAGSTDGAARAHLASPPPAIVRTVERIELLDSEANGDSSSSSSSSSSSDDGDVSGDDDFVGTGFVKASAPTRARAKKPQQPAGTSRFLISRANLVKAFGLMPALPLNVRLYVSVHGQSLHEDVEARLYRWSDQGALLVLPSPTHQSIMSYVPKVPGAKARLKPALCRNFDLKWTAHVAPPSCPRLLLDLQPPPPAVVGSAGAAGGVGTSAALAPTSTAAAVVECKSAADAACRKPSGSRPTLPESVSPHTADCLRGKKRHLHAEGAGNSSNDEGDCALAAEDAGQRVKTQWPAGMSRFMISMNNLVQALGQMPALPLSVRLRVSVHGAAVHEDVEANILRWDSSYVSLLLPTRIHASILSYVPKLPGTIARLQSSRRRNFDFKWTAQDASSACPRLLLDLLPPPVSVKPPISEPAPPAVSSALPAAPAGGGSTAVADCSALVVWGGSAPAAVPAVGSQLLAGSAPSAGGRDTQGEPAAALATGSRSLCSIPLAGVKKRQRLALEGVPLLDGGSSGEVRDSAGGNLASEDADRPSVVRPAQVPHPPCEQQPDPLRGGGADGDKHGGASHPLKVEAPCDKGASQGGKLKFQFSMAYLVQAFGFAPTLPMNVRLYVTVHGQAVHEDVEARLRRHHEQCAHLFLPAAIHQSVMSYVPKEPGKSTRLQRYLNRNFDLKWTAQDTTSAYPRLILDLQPPATQGVPGALPSDKHTALAGDARTAAAPAADVNVMEADGGNAAVGTATGAVAAGDATVARIDAAAVTGSITLTAAGDKADTAGQVPLALVPSAECSGGKKRQLQHPDQEDDGVTSSDDSDSSGDDDAIVDGATEAAVPSQAQGANKRQKGASCTGTSRFRVSYRNVSNAFGRMPALPMGVRLYVSVRGQAVHEDVESRLLRFDDTSAHLVLPTPIHQSIMSYVPKVPGKATRLQRALCRGFDLKWTGQQEPRACPRFCLDLQPPVPLAARAAAAAAAVTATAADGPVVPAGSGVAAAACGAGPGVPCSTAAVGARTFKVSALDRPAPLFTDTGDGVPSSSSSDNDASSDDDFIAEDESAAHARMPRQAPTVKSLPGAIAKLYISITQLVQAFGQMPALPLSVRLCVSVHGAAVHEDIKGTVRRGNPDSATLFVPTWVRESILSYVPKVPGKRTQLQRAPCRNFDLKWTAQDTSSACPLLQLDLQPPVPADGPSCDGSVAPEGQCHLCDRPVPPPAAAGAAVVSGQQAATHEAAGTGRASPGAAAAAGAGAGAALGGVLAAEAGVAKISGAGQRVGAVAGVCGLARSGPGVARGTLGGGLGTEVGPGPTTGTGLLTAAGAGMLAGAAAGAGPSQGAASAGPMPVGGAGARTELATGVKPDVGSGPGRAPQPGPGQTVQRSGASSAQEEVLQHLCRMLDAVASRAASAPELASESQRLQAAAIAVAMGHQALDNPAIRQLLTDLPGLLTASGPGSSSGGSSGKPLAEVLPLLAGSITVLPQERVRQTAEQLGLDAEDQEVHVQLLTRAARAAAEMAVGPAGPPGSSGAGGAGLQAQRRVGLPELGYLQDQAERLGEMFPPESLRNPMHVLLPAYKQVWQQGPLVCILAECLGHAQAGRVSVEQQPEHKITGELMRLFGVAGGGGQTGWNSLQAAAKATLQSVKSGSSGGLEPPEAIPDAVIYALLEPEVRAAKKAVLALHPQCHQELDDTCVTAGYALCALGVDGLAQSLASVLQLVYGEGSQGTGMDVQLSVAAVAAGYSLHGGDDVKASLYMRLLKSAQRVVGAC